MQKIFWGAVFFILLLLFAVTCQPVKLSTASTKDSNKIDVVFYNVENLFDTINEPVKWDNDWTPKGKKLWTSERYNRKLGNIARVLTGSVGWGYPALIGLSEVENRQVLEDLVSNTYLSNGHYRILHQESPDLRGIDVACLVDTNRIGVLYFGFKRVQRKKGYSGPTRDILWTALTIESDTFLFFVNHWPSRMGGVEKTYMKREYVSSHLISLVDSLVNHFPKAGYVFCGDFNDNPQNSSVLLLQKYFSDSTKSTLLNLSEIKSNEIGTHKYRGNWNDFDQFLFTNNLLEIGSLDTLNSGIFAADWLLEYDKSYGGHQPMRTYHGYRYNNGFSDHLPVRLSLKID